jgi:murein DD-endopeptidase MepM/ murein hydrolase activator NlpD
LRRDYAAALLAQLAVQVRGGHALAFGLDGAQAVAQRIGLIRDARPVAHAPWAGIAALLLVPGLCGASVLLQPRFAWNQPAHTSLPAPKSANAALTHTPVAAPSWQPPLAHLRVTSAFGSTNRPGGKPHGGVDLGAARGTPVLAPAAGKVAVSTDRFEGGARYGKVVAIDHADGSRSLYAHLDARLVRAGDLVRAGQRIALTGATGKVTGPHLHFEVARDGAAVDPQTLLGSAAD